MANARLPNYILGAPQKFGSGGSEAGLAVSDIFFSARGRGTGFEAPERGEGVGVLLKIPEGGGVCQERGGRGAGRCLRGIGGVPRGGVNIILLGGRNSHQEDVPSAIQEPLCPSFPCFFPETRLRKNRAFGKGLECRKWGFKRWGLKRI